MFAKLIKWIVVGIVLIAVIAGGILFFLSSKKPKEAPVYRTAIPKSAFTKKNSKEHRATGSMTISPNAISDNVLSGVADEKRIKPLPSAPIRKITQNTDTGSIPVIAKDGSKPWRLYAQPYKFKNSHPKVAIVLGPIGLSQTGFKLAVDKMPLEVTFILSSYSHNIFTKSKMIRVKGHEFLIEFPTESGSYDRDSGPKTLRHTQNPTQLLDAMNVLLSSTTGYMGAALMYGDSFVSNRSKLHIVVSELNSRGLLTFDDGSAGTRSMLKVLAVKALAPYAETDQSLKSTQTSAEVEKHLKQAYAKLVSGKNQVILVEPQPRLMQMVINWISLHGGRKTNGSFELVPLSAISHNRS